MKDFDALIQEVQAEARLLQSQTGGLGSLSDEGWERLQFRLDHVTPSGQKIRAWLNSLASEEAVRALYQHILGREPDPVGMDWALRELNNGVPVLLLAGHIMLSPEGRLQGYRLDKFRVYKLLARLRSIARRLGMDRLVVIAARLVALGHRTLDARPTPGSQPVALPVEWQVMLERQAGQLGLAQAAVRSLDRQTQSLRRELAVLGSRAKAQTQTGVQTQANSSTPKPLQTQVQTPSVLEALQDGAAGLHTPLPAQAMELHRYYLAFEDHHRGSAEQVHAKFLAYQPWLKRLASSDKQGVDLLDLGCGRGEWLAFAQQQGLKAEGVDSNPVMVQTCLDQGLHAREDNLLSALTRQPSGSLLAITAFHVAEHLPFETLFTMVQQAFRCLKPEGILLLETPNPENLMVATHTFYHDHTHRNPLTPDALRFLLVYHGFEQLEVLRLNPYPESAQIPGVDPAAQRLHAMVNGPQDFAVLGHRPA